MLPKIIRKHDKFSSQNMKIKQDEIFTIADTLICEDHLKYLLGKSKNLVYKPIKDIYIPKLHDTPFGNFPKEKINRIDPFNLNKEIITKTDPDENHKKFRLPKIKNKNSEKPKAGAFLRRNITLSEFRHIYDRGDFPFKIDYQNTHKKLIWLKDPSNIDYHYYFPVIFDGLREKIDPYRFLSITAVCEMIEKGANKIIPVIPQIILPLKSIISLIKSNFIIVNLNTRDSDIILVNLKILQKLVKSNDLIGPALVPYFRQILPIFNLFKNKNINLGDKMDYSQRKNINLGDLIDETLQILEKYGGEDAYINIKYSIPTFESCQYQ